MTKIKTFELSSNIVKCMGSLATENFIHRLRYEADTTDPTNISVLNLIDEVEKVENGVLRGVIGTIILDHHAPRTDMVLSAVAFDAINEFNDIVSLLEKGEVK
nr:MAG TPA: hypothetical protein [Caudoviricetes sp.]